MPMEACHAPWPSRNDNVLRLHRCAARLDRTTRQFRPSGSAVEARDAGLWRASKFGRTTLAPCATIWSLIVATRPWRLMPFRAAGKRFPRSAVAIEGHQIFPMDCCQEAPARRPVRAEDFARREAKLKRRRRDIACGQQTFFSALSVGLRPASLPLLERKSCLSRYRFAA